MRADQSVKDIVHNSHVTREKCPPQLRVGVNHHSHGLLEREHHLCQVAFCRRLEASLLS